MTNDYYQLVSKLLNLVQYTRPGLLGNFFFGQSSVDEVEVHHVNKMAKAFYERDWGEIIWIGAGENYPRENWPLALAFRYCLLYGYAHFRDAEYRDNGDHGYNLSKAATMARRFTGISSTDIKALDNLVEEARKR
jgi:hypothetical protein